MLCIDGADGRDGSWLATQRLLQAEACARDRSWVRVRQPVEIALENSHGAP